MYSIAITTFMLLTKRRPFVKDGALDAALQEASNWAFLERYTFLSDEAKSFIARCGDPSYKSRLSCRGALQHPFILRTSLLQREKEILQSKLGTNIYVNPVMAIQKVLRSLMYVVANSDF